MFIMPLLWQIKLILILMYGKRAEHIVRSVNNLRLARYRSGLRLSTSLKTAMTETTVP